MWKTYLVEIAIASIVNELERHVGTVRNAADSSVGQVERNAKPAAPSGAGKVSDQLLPSGWVSEVVERRWILHGRNQDAN